MFSCFSFIKAGSSTGCNVNVKRSQCSARRVDVVAVDNVPATAGWPKDKAVAPAPTVFLQRL